MATLGKEEKEQMGTPAMDKQVDEYAEADKKQVDEYAEADKKQVEQLKGFADLSGMINDGLKSNRALDAATKARLRRRQRNEELVNSITDAANAISNLVFTTKGAPNSFDYAQGLSEQSRARWDKMWKDREAEDDRHNNYLMKGYNLYQQALNRKEAREKEAAALERQKEALDYQRRRDAEEDARKQELHPYQVSKAEAEAKKAADEAAIWKAYRESQIAHNKNGGRGRGGAGSRSTFTDAQKAQIIADAVALGVPVSEVVNTAYSSYEKPRDIYIIAAGVKAKQEQNGGAQNQGQKGAAPKEQPQNTGYYHLSKLKLDK